MLHSRRLILLGGAATMASVARPARAREQAPAGVPWALRAQKSQARLPGSIAPTDILSFDGSPAGPVLRITQGSDLDLRLSNDLDVPLSLQWHGVRAPDAIEGNWPLAGSLVQPGSTQVIRLTPPDSGVFWFHAAALPGQPDLTRRGLRGALVVDEPAPPLTDHDALLTIADWPSNGEAGARVLTVNGGEAPVRATIVPGGRLRLRVINASTRRAMVLALDGARPLVMAIDGQPSDLFEPVRESVPAGPGARFEFMIDLPREPGAVFSMALREDGRSTVLFECRTDGVARDALPAIAALPRNPHLPLAIPLERSARADLRIEAADGPVRWRLNGTTSLDPARRPLLSLKRGGTVTLGFDNRTGMVVPMRVHGHVMRLLHAKDDGWEPYWRDSVILLPNSISHVAFVADAPGRWLIESALFEQAAFGLRHWFEVR